MPLKRVLNGLNYMDGLDYKERKRRERNKSGSSKIFLDGRYA